MEKPRYEWSYRMDRNDWPYEIYDNQECHVVARCETKDDVTFLHSLLADDDAKCAPSPSDRTVYGSVAVQFPKDAAQNMINSFYYKTLGRKP